MKIKSYYSRTVEDAIACGARRRLGPDAMLVNSRKAPSEARHLGEYEVVFATSSRRVGRSAASTRPRPRRRWPAPPSSDRLSVGGGGPQEGTGRHAPGAHPHGLRAVSNGPGLRRMSRRPMRVLTAAEVSPELAREIVQADPASRSGIAPVRRSGVAQVRRTPRFQRRSGRGNLPAALRVEAHAGARPGRHRGSSPWSDLRAPARPRRWSNWR